MTSKEAYQKGYRVVAASPFEVGLTKDGRGLRTWFSQDFDGKIPTLDHYLIQECIESHEKLIKEGLV
jgi:hypothetical protein